MTKPVQAYAAVNDSEPHMVATTNKEDTALDDAMIAAGWRVEAVTILLTEQYEALIVAMRTIDLHLGSLNKQGIRELINDALEPLGRSLDQETDARLAALKEQAP